MKKVILITASIVLSQFAILNAQDEQVTVKSDTIESAKEDDREKPILDMIKEEIEKEKKAEKEKKFKGHYEGIQFGLNGLMNSNYELTRSTENAYMDLNTGKSWFFNISLGQFEYALIKKRLGIVSGLGINWNNYHFDGNNNIQKVNGIVESKAYADTSLKKSKLGMAFLSAPVLIEVQLPKDVYFNVGVIGGFKLYSRSKIVYHVDGDKEKEKEKDDFNLNSLRLGATARLGYDNVALYGTYYFTPMFETDKGPELYPINVGLALSF